MTEWMIEDGVLMVTGKGKVDDHFAAEDWKHTVQTIEIGEGITELGIGAFEGCENLETVFLPKTIKRIAARCFSGCTNLTDIYLYKRNQYSRKSEEPEYRFIYEPVPDRRGYDKESEVIFGIDAFKDVPWAIKKWGANYIKDGVLYTCFHTDDPVVIPEGVRKIHQFALKDVSAEAIEFPSSLCELEALAFSDVNCRLINLPESIKTVGPFAFSGSGIEQIIFSCQSEPEIHENAFDGMNFPVKLPKNKRGKLELPEAYELVLEKSSLYGDFKRYKVQMKKPDTGGVVGTDAVDCAKHMIPKLKKDHLAVGVIFNSGTKMIEDVRSLRWNDWENNLYLYQVTPHYGSDGTLDGKHSFIWSKEVKEVQYELYSPAAGELAAGGYDIMKYRDPNMHEEWFLGPGHYFCYGPEEFRLLEFWLKAHPDYKLPED